MVADTQSQECKVRKFKEFMAERLMLTEVQHFAEKKQVPVHSQSVWYYMGGVALVLLGVQIVTGILLMVYYVPEISAAHASILRLNSQIQFGWFIRSLHSWGSTLMISFVLVHFFSTFFMRSYRKPRELNWLTGLVLLVCVLAFGFTGYLLPWDMVSFFATKIGLEIASKGPFIGQIVAELLRGGDTVGQATISRFFVMHVAALPMVLLILLGLHLLFVQLHGMSEPDEFKELPADKKTYEQFFPNFFFKDILVWILAFNALCALVMLCPWGIGTEADPFGAAPIGIRPEWYFLGPFQFLKLIPSMVGPMEGEVFGMLIMGLVAAGFVLVPFYDNGASKGRAENTTLCGVVVVLALVVLTVWGAVS